MYKDHHLPSWSWMAFSGIEFVCSEALSVPRDEDLRFKAEKQDALFVQVRVIRGCNLDQDQHIIVDAEGKKVGRVWFDAKTKTRFQDCVVVGMKIDDKANHEKTYYILLVERIWTENDYKRIGVGTIIARCISRESLEGKLL